MASSFSDRDPVSTEPVIEQRKPEATYSPGRGTLRGSQFDNTGRFPVPLPPKRFTVKAEGTAVRCVTIDYGEIGNGSLLSGNVRYDVYWAETVDTSTAAGIEAGFARATCLAPSLPAPRVEDQATSMLLTDPKFLSGYYFCVGVDAQGRKSEPTAPISVSTEGVNSAVPGNVTHLQVSESGETGQDGTVYSVLSVSCQAPTPLTSFAGVQLFLEHYLKIDSTEQAYYHRFYGAASGSMQFKVAYPIARRQGVGTLTVTNASSAVTSTGGLMSIARSGDQIEVLGKRATIQSLTDTSITLTGNWTGQSVATTDFSIIGLVRIYAVSISQGGTYRADWQSSPYYELLMDGELSAPNAPANVYANAIDNVVRIEWDQVAGSKIAKYNVYRSEGSSTDTGMASAPPVPTSGTKLISSVPTSVNSISSTSYVRMQAEDSNFTEYQRESLQVFRYYVSTVNSRGDESACASASTSCRTTTPSDVDPSVPSRGVARNFLYNSFIGGNAASSVLANDTSQDVYTGSDASNLPGRPYGAASGQANGTGRFRGFTRWEANDGGTGASGSVTFVSENQVKMGAPGTANEWYLYQEIGAWQHGTAAFMKIGKNAYYVLSAYVKHGGVTPNGYFRMYLDQYDANTYRGHSLRRYRDTNSNLVTSATVLQIAGSSITSTWQRFYSVFRTDSSLGTTKELRVNFQHADSTAGDIYVSQVMLSEGEELTAWTADMGDTTQSTPIAGDPTPGIGDGSSGRVGDIRAITPEG